MEPHFGFAKSDIAQLATLKKGTKITLVCIGKGDVAKTPMSGSCSIVGDDVAPSESANPIKRIPITPPEDSDVFINGRGQVLVSGSPNKRVLQCVQDRVDKEKKFTDGWDDQIVAECNKLKAP